MADLSDEAMNLLAASRITEAPSLADRHRIRAGIAAATGVAVVASAASAAVVSSTVGPASAALVSSAAGSASAAVVGTAAATKAVVAAAIAAVLGLGGGALIVYSMVARSPAASVSAPSPRVPEPSPAPVVRVPEPARAEPAPPLELPIESRPRAMPAPPVVREPALPTATKADSGLAAELALIRAADAALAAHDAGRVLVVVDQHATRFAKGQLAQERESMRVLALCALGRTHDARVVADGFFARWPDSPHAARLRSMTECIASGHSH